MVGMNGEGRRFSFGSGFDVARGGDTFKPVAYSPTSVIDNNFASSGLGYGAQDRTRLSYSGTPISGSPNGETTDNWQKRVNLSNRPRTL